MATQLSTRSALAAPALVVILIAALSATAITHLGAAGAVDVTFTEWQTPSNPPYPHDPAYFAGDGSVWYTGQRANVIGRLIPSTGEMKEWTLPTANSGPHGLIPDSSGRIWYTGNSAGLIGVLDPKTGKITEHKMPDPAARDPHTPLFGLDGLLYFTVQGGNFVGRLDPATGAITLKTPPTADSRPYGLVQAKTGLLYFDQFNSNRIGQLDPKTMAIREFPLPNAAARPRRIAMAVDDTVYYTDYARGFLGHLSPATGAVTEFASPGGSDSRPYAIAVTHDGIVWYCETGTDANMLVRFDPASKAMQTWKIPSGGGVVRHMVTGAPNELWLAESGVGKIARAVIH